MLLAATLLLSWMALMSQTSSTPCAVPGSAATADQLAAKFDEHQFIFIGSTHGDAKIEEFLMCLVSRPAFQQRVTDIVVESASSGHQPLLDRYLLKLEEIAADDLTPMDAFVYLGPEPDRNLTGVTPANDDATT